MKLRVTFGLTSRWGAFGMIVAVVAFGAPAAGTKGVFAISKDTLYERKYFSSASTDEVRLFNRGNTPLRIDSLSVHSDHRLFRTVSMDFGTETYTQGVWTREWVFYWHDGTTRTWLSQPLIIPPRDSMRIHYLRLDRCARCDAKPLPDPETRDMTATLKFHSDQGAVSLTIRAWYKR